ncbi:MAG TPA: hypothetical protein VKX17_00340, partial [Planctomycetota bacterium]|nr:hypothetical protein [Planctomycetota bacterium]
MRNRVVLSLLAFMAATACCAATSGDEPIGAQPDPGLRENLGDKERRAKKPPRGLRDNNDFFDEPIVPLPP